MKKGEKYLLKGRQHEYVVDLVDEIPEAMRGRTAASLTVAQQLKHLAQANPDKVIRIDISEHPGTSGLATSLVKDGFKQATTRRLDNRTFLYVK